MSVDYYQTLELERKANQQDIERSFKRLGLKWHPQVCKEDEQTAKHNFCQIAEAYEVLSDSMKRAFYDKYGEEKLKAGFFCDGKLSGGYHFAGNPEEIFEKFFEKTNPYANLHDDSGNENLGTLFGHAFGGQQYVGANPPKDLKVSVECTLKELYNGCSKDIWYNRRVLNPDGKTTQSVQQKKTLEIKRGYGEDFKLCFKNEGNMAPQQPTSNLILNVIAVPCQGYQRQGNNLVYTLQISLLDALLAMPIRKIETLDGRILTVSMDSIVDPEAVKVVKGEGMPINDDNNLDAKTVNAPRQFGDLLVKFDIQFPQQLSVQKQRQVVKALC